MDSHRQAYFHDRPNISSVQINVKNLSQENNIYAMFRKAKIIDKTIDKAIAKIIDKTIERIAN